MDRVFAIVEIIPCPQGYDIDCCYDVGRMNDDACMRNGNTCQRDGTAVRMVPARGGQYTEDLLDRLETGVCLCASTGHWTHHLQAGNVMKGGTGVSVMACKDCHMPKMSAIAAGWGACTAVPR